MFVSVANTLPITLPLKSEDLDTLEKRAKYTVCIIGCSLKGLFFATIFAETGFKVICVDADQSTIKKISKGNTPVAGYGLEKKLKRLMKTEKLVATSDLKNAVSKSDIILITTNTKVDSKKNSDYTQATSCFKQVGAALQRGKIVLYTGIASVGLIEGVFKEILENTSGLKVGEDFGLAYTPFQNAATLNRKEDDTQEFIIAGIEKTSLNSATAILKVITKREPKLTSNIKTAELATLFEAIRYDLNVALTNELAVLCESLGVDYIETLGLITNNYEICSTTPTIAENNKEESYLLLESAENLNIKLRLPALSRQINEEIIKHAVNLTQEALRCGGKTLRRAKIAVLGATNSRTANKAFFELLESKGTKIIRYDPQVNESQLPESGKIFKKTINETVEGTDCIIILSEQEQLKRLNLKKLKAIMKSPAAIIDLTATVEPRKALEEGFTYRGLGRGGWKN